MYPSISLRETDFPQPEFGQVVVSISTTSSPRDVLATSLLPHPGLAGPS